METLFIQRDAAQRAPGKSPHALVGVVASGNLEVLLERVLDGVRCEVHVKTPAAGFGEVWRAVIEDFIERQSPGGLRISINDCGARPDTVSLRLAQGVRLMT
ncbi:MAG: malonate decarboxylase acyl carrier protein, partial [Verrucomicrobia bacterium]|nr:malonate decarboxylase acyl carrier protein [Verrucomicrobiota bacterium]